MTIPLTWTQKRRFLKYFEPSIRKHPNRPVIISEGDSWFSFPLHTNTIEYLDRMARRKISLLRLEKSGDEILSILAGKQKKKLRRYLGRYPVQALLFSGGGNDIVGSDLLGLLKEKKPGMTWEDCIHKTAVRRRLQQIRNAYLDLVQIRDEQRSACRIYVHGYDYAIPSGRGITIIQDLIEAGPWMKPFLEQMKITDFADQKRIVRWLIDQFNDLLSGLASTRRDFVHVKTRRTLKSTEWHDELHPTPGGFRKVAEKFRVQLSRQFPGTF